MAGVGDGISRPRSTNLRPSLVYLACLLTFGASFGAGLKVFPLPAPHDATVSLAASKVLDISKALDIVPQVAAAPPPAAEPERKAAKSEPTAVDAVPQVTAAPQPTAALFDPTPMQPRMLAADIKPLIGPPAPQSPADGSSPGASGGPVSPVVRGISREPAPPPSGAREPESTRLQDTTRPHEFTNVQEPVRRKPARRDVAAKRHGGEALRTVRRFGDDLQDVPVRSYSGDGKPVDIRIRPTSIQDVYYYSWRP